MHHPKPTKKSFFSYFLGLPIFEAEELAPSYPECSEQSGQEVHHNHVATQPSQAQDLPGQRAGPKKCVKPGQTGGHALQILLQGGEGDGRRRHGRLRLAL